MKILSVLFFLALSFSVFPAEGDEAYSRRPDYYTVELTLDWNGSRWEPSFRVGVASQSYRPPMSFDEGRHFYRSSDVESPVFVERVLDDSTSIEVFPKWVKRLHIVIAPIRKGLEAPEYIDLSEEKILKDLRFYESVRHVLIRQEQPDCEVRVNFSDWYQYAAWKKREILRSFEIDAPVQPAFNLEDLKPFGDLERLSLPMTVGDELSYFPKLTHLALRGVRSAFTHQVVQLKHLIAYREIPGLYTNQFETFHAERYFFLSYLPKVTKVDTFSSFYTTGAFDQLLNSAYDLLPDRWRDNGSLLVLENELPAYCPGSFRNDTLLHGMLKDGQPEGIWTFRLADDYKCNDFEAHQLNFDRKAREIPQNGRWTFSYVNGNTAIEGRFKKGKKQGEWHFYAEDGTLKSSKWFRNDTLVRTVIQLEIDHVSCEARTYYINGEACVQSFSNPNKTFFTYVDLNPVKPDALIFGDKSISVKLEDRSGYKVVSRSNPEFENVFRTYFLEPLFPELSGKEVPFEY